LVHVEAGPFPPWESRHKGRSGQSQSQPQTRSTEQPQTAVVYHGNVSCKVFHGPACQHCDCKNCTAVFKSKDEALKAGYRPHEECVR
jgi:micrococcal nuclease